MQYLEFGFLFSNSCTKIMKNILNSKKKNTKLQRLQNKIDISKIVILVYVMFKKIVIRAEFKKHVYFAIERTKTR